MKRVILYDHVGTGLIIKYPSGVLYSNQTGGNICLQPEEEGIFVPIGNDVALPSGILLSKQTALRAYFEGPRWQGSGAIGRLTEVDALFIDQLLAQLPNFGYIRVNRTRLGESHEAWVHVLVHTEEDESSLAIISGFGPGPLEAILTWQNSD